MPAVKKKEKTFLSGFLESLRDVQILALAAAFITLGWAVYAYATDLAVGPAIVILLRLVVPLGIFRWHLIGGIFAIIFDAFDVVLLTLIGAGDFSNYTLVDKALDTYFILFMAVVSVQWLRIALITSLSLFGWRMIGVLLLEVFHGPREILFIFPNLFLPFWLFESLRQKYRPEWVLTWKRTITVLLIILVPKLIQEYLLHVAQVQPWEWTQRLLGMQS